MGDRITGELFIQIFKRSLDKAGKQRMRTVWPRFKFRMGLCGDEPGMLRKLDHLDDPSIRGNAGQLHAVFGQGLAVVVVDLIPVAVALVNRFLAV